MKMKYVFPIIVAMLFLVACSSGNKEKTGTNNVEQKEKAVYELIVPEKPVQGGTITLGVGYPDAINPIFSDSLWGAYISRFVHGYLFSIDSKLEVIADLCSEVPSVGNGMLSEDGLEYTLKLRENLKWHDGEPLTTDDIKFTHNIIKTMHVQHHVVYLDEYANIKSAEIINDREIKFTLNHPSPSFLNIFITHPVLPKHILYEAQSRDLPIYNKKPVGAGPFKIASWNRNEPLVLKAFHNYHSGKPFLDKIILKFHNNEMSPYDSIKNWVIDGYIDATDFRSDMDSADSEINVYNTLSLNWEIMGINNDHPILRNPEIRQAMVKAIDRKKILKDCYNNKGELAYSDVPSFSPLFNSAVKSKSAFDPQSSMKLLESLGWTDSDGDKIRDNGSQRLEFTILVDKNNTERMKTAKQIASDLMKVGIKTNITAMSSEQILDKFNNGGLLENGNYELALYGWTLSFNDNNGNMWLSDKTPPKGHNYSRFNNGKIAGLYGKLRNENNNEEIKKISFQMQEIIAEELPVMPILFKTRTDLYRKTIIGIQPHPVKWMTPWNCYDWWLVPEKQE